MNWTTLWFRLFRHRPQQTRVLTSITLSGSSGVIVTHGTQYTPIGYDQNGAAMSFTPTYHSSNTAKATIDSTGAATGVAAGSTNIYADAVNSLGATITSNTIALTVSAQVATSPVLVSPSSFTTTVSGTQPLAATVNDQVTPPNVIAGASVSWGSSASGVASVNSSTGLVTGVSAGSATITATSGSATGTSSASVSGGGGVTSVTVYYNGQAAPFLAFTTQTYALTAKDQDGNTLSGGTWSSTDATNAPINSSTGVVSPNNLLTGATFTYLHSDGVHSGTIKATVLKLPTWVKTDKALNYGTDTDLRLAISTNVNNNGFHTPAATGNPSTALYYDGFNAGYLTLDTTNLFNGEKTFLMTYNSGFSGKIELAVKFPSTYNRMFTVQVFQFTPGFTGLGSGGGGASYKTGLSLYNDGKEGRTAVDYTNVLPNQAAAIDLMTTLQESGSTVGGASETALTSGSRPEWSNGLWYMIVMMYDGSSGTSMAARAWMCKVGDHPINDTILATTTVTGPMLGGRTPMQMNASSVFGQNYNQTVISTMSKRVGLWGACSGVSVNDPLGILGT